jgi:hypothetical protein
VPRNTFLGRALDLLLAVSLNKLQKIIKVIDIEILL